MKDIQQLKEEFDKLEKADNLAMYNTPHSSNNYSINLSLI